MTISPGNFPIWMNCMSKPTMKMTTPIVISSLPIPVNPSAPPILDDDKLNLSLAFLLVSAAEIQSEEDMVHTHLQSYLLLHQWLQQWFQVQLDHHEISQ